MKCLIVLGIAVSAALPQEIPQFEKRTLALHHVTYGYRLLRPQKVEEGRRYPLVFFLHGAGERGSDNQASLRYFPEQMSRAPYRNDFPAYVVVPQCNLANRWVEVDWGARRSSRMQVEPSTMMAMAMALLDESIRNLPIDTNRVYLAGISMGGFGAWELAARHPNTFAAVVPICGGGDEATAHLLTKLPIWAWHGADDPVVPPERSRRMIDAVRAAGGSPKYTELPGVGHNSFVQAFAPESGLVRWMFDQRLARLGM